MHSPRPSAPAAPGPTFLAGSTAGPNVASTATSAKNSESRFTNHQEPTLGLAGDLVKRADRPQASRRTRRSSLPAGLFGRSARNSISRGYLYGAVTRFTNS